MVDKNLYTNIHDWFYNAYKLKEYNINNLKNIDNNSCPLKYAFQILEGLIYFITD